MGTNRESVSTGVKRVAILGTLLLTGVSVSQAAVWRVCSKSPCEFRSIQEALDAAGDGDTIRVLDRVHSEGAVDVHESVTIAGRGADRTLVQPADFPGLAVNGVFVVRRGVVATIRDMTIRGGIAEQPGGGIQNSGTLTVEHTAIIQNVSFASGGGIWCGPGGELTLANSMVGGNTAWPDSPLGAGGGIHALGCVVTVESSTISDNDARFGGGVICEDPCSITNSTISGNRSLPNAPGGIAAATAGLFNNTITNNTSGVGGNGNLARNNIIAGNGQRDCHDRALLSEGSNLFGQGTGCSSIDPTDRTVNPAAVFTSVLGPLVDNGGPTSTHDLLTGSPAIDAVVGACPARDQRGVARPVDGDRDHESRCDIGAVEHLPRGGGTLL